MASVLHSPAPLVLNFCFLRPSPSLWVFTLLFHQRQPAVCTHLFFSSGRLRPILFHSFHWSRTRSFTRHRSFFTSVDSIPKPLTQLPSCTLNNTCICCTTSTLHFSSRAAIDSLHLIFFLFTPGLGHIHSSKLPLTAVSHCLLTEQRLSNYPSNRFLANNAFLCDDYNP